MFIVIRGTKARSEWSDNFNAEEVYNNELKAWFHKSFNKYAKDIWIQTGKYIKNHEGEIVLTGHSRGAALAEILLIYAKNRFPQKNIICMAFAPPPAMSHDGKVLLYSKYIYSFIFRNDAVPRLFVSVMSNICQQLSGGQDCNIVDAVKRFSDLLGSQNNDVINGLTEHSWLLDKRISDYQKDPNSLKISRILGEVYELDYKDNTNEFKPLRECKVENPTDQMWWLQYYQRALFNAFSVLDDHRIQQYVLYFKKVSQYNLNFDNRNPSNSEI